MSKRRILNSWGCWREGRWGEGLVDYDTGQANSSNSGDFLGCPVVKTPCFLKRAKSLLPRQGNLIHKA